MNIIINDKLIDTIKAKCETCKRTATFGSHHCFLWEYCKDLTEEDEPDNWGRYSSVEIVTNRIVTVRRD